MHLLIMVKQVVTKMEFRLCTPLSLPESIIGHSYENVDYVMKVELIRRSWISLERRQIELSEGIHQIDSYLIIF